MAHGTCEVDGCERDHLARGLCSSHYSTWHRQTYGRKPRIWPKCCEGCGEEWNASAKAGRFCSLLCYTFSTFGPQSCYWSPPRPRVDKVKPPPFRERRACVWCGVEFVATSEVNVFCCASHRARAKRVRRRGREHGWTSNFTWAEVMRVFKKFDGRCAYCDAVLAGLPDPDHVVPLSKGGCNSITNILPCCSLCNSDKRDLLLPEWAADRERRGLPLRITTWVNMDRRITHLTVL